MLTKMFYFGMSILLIMLGLSRLVPDGNWLWIGILMIGCVTLGVIIRDVWFEDESAIGATYDRR